MSAHALTLTVGSTGCDYSDLAFVVDGLTGVPGPHEIRLRAQTFSVPDGLELDASAANISIRGGYASCSDSTPSAGQRSIIDASGGVNGTALAIGAAPDSPIHLVTLRRITVRGGTPAGGSSALGGGGLLILGKVFVVLDDETFIENNESGNGGGVLIAGWNSNNRPTLQILSDSRIANNSAQLSGGGIYCYDYASVYIDGGVVAQNTAMETGGGVYLHKSCVLDSIVVPGSVTGLFENQAQRGGGIFAIGNSPLTIQGDASAPFWLAGNRASITGGGIEVRSSPGGRTAVNLLTSVFVGNEAASRGAAVYIAGDVDLAMRPLDGHERCAFPDVGFEACSAVIGNVAPFTDGSTSPGSVIESVYASPGSPSLNVSRTAIVDNEADVLLHGLLRSADYGIDIEGSLITRNNVTRGLVLLENLEEFFPSENRIAWSTVSGNTKAQASSYVLAHFASPLNLTGSIVYEPDFVDRSSSTGSVTHGGCLLVDDAMSWPSTPIPPRVGNPNLNGGMAPSPTSPAIDICASAQAPATDFNGSPRSFDQPAVPNVYGPVDLGAIELPFDDTIFANGFE
ncbi:choice-of-anchor Q domain-containing protein [Dokdonella sp.]|uniref:choice-of-anchor Q domain-containing protein n=1 Tax=Dokdonella sp. TaxID=2291710 RepID=UPI0035281BCB